MSFQTSPTPGLVQLGSTAVEAPAAPELRPPDEMTAGMRLRRRQFGTAFEFFAPGLKRWQTAEWKPKTAQRFLPISVTGTACALDCDHCGTKVLEGMITVSKESGLFETARRLVDQGTEGILVSGGSMRSGEVPLGPHFDDMRRIRDELGMKVIVHSGVVGPDLAAGLADAQVDGVMLDIIGTDDTIRDVYHLDLTVDDFESSLDLLTTRGLRIIPHIVLGLHYGRFRGEWNALQMIGRHPVDTLILVVLTPLVGTPMADLPPPPAEQVEAFFANARATLPDVHLNLGCGRPMGAMKVALDKAAVDQGLNGIAYPAEGIVEYARASGLDPEFYEACCSMTWAHDESSGKPNHQPAPRSCPTP